MLKYIIQEDAYSYEVDWSKRDTIEGGWVEEYLPTVEESIDALMELLSNVYSKEKIADALTSGHLASLDYSKKGLKYGIILREMNEQEEEAEEKKDDA